MAELSPSSQRQQASSPEPPPTSETQPVEPPLSSTAVPAGQATAAPETTVNPKQHPEAENDISLDAFIVQDIDMIAGESSNTNNQDNPATNNIAEPGNPIPRALPASIDPLAANAPPSKKESSLREFLGKMDEYASIIPDSVTAHYLTLAGLPPPGNGPNQTPPHLARLLALATQKFIADIAADSYQYARIRASNSSSASNPMGSLNAASGLTMPTVTGGGGSSGAGGGGSGEAGKGKTGAHLGIQRPGFGGGGTGGSGQGRTVLTMEDLGMAVAEYGVSIKRGEFYR